MQDKREHKRYELPVQVTIEAVSDNNRLLEDARLIDIGPGGACFGLKADLETGLLVGLTIPNINDGFYRAFGLSSNAGEPLSIKLQGEVLRSEKAATGSGERKVAIRFCGPVRITSADSQEVSDRPRDIGKQDLREGGSSTGDSSIPGDRK